MSSPTTDVAGTEAERLAAVELSRVFQLVLRLRIAGAPLAMIIGVLFILYDEAWRGIVCLTAAVPVFFLSVWELRTLGKQWLSPRRITSVIASIGTIQLALIVVTGGIGSPILIVVPAVAVGLAVLVGRPRLVFGFVTAMIAFAWTLGYLGLTRPAFEPAFMARGPLRPAFVWLAMFVLTVVPLVGAAVGRRLRGALERAVRSAAESRMELVGNMRERNHELLAMAGAVAHELKNPLAAIRGLAALQAKRVEAGSKQAEQMGVLLDEVARMGTILDEFLNFSRPTDGLALENLDATQIIRDVVRIHEPLAAERGVSLALRPAKLPPLSSDPRKLKQVLVNLIQNAIDASPADTEVTASIAVDDGEHVFRIEDRGAGLSDAVRGRLFTLGATTKLAGSGLGLTIARAIAEQHGGSLSLTERDGGGCVAELRLPSAATAREDGAS